MSRHKERRGRRRYRTGWSIGAFIVIALIICILVILWQMRGDPPKHTDVDAAPTVPTVATAG